MATPAGAPAGTSSDITSRAAARPRSLASHRAREKNQSARPCGQHRESPAPQSIPQTVRFPGWARKPQARPVNVRNDGAVNSGANQASSVISDAGTISGSISRRPFPRKGGKGHGRPPPAIMGSMPQTPGEQAQNAVTARITAHIAAGWPRLGPPEVRFRGRYCYATVTLPGHRQPTPFLRLRWQGSLDEWAIGIYKASTEQYSENEFPWSYGPLTGTPEQGIDETLALYAGPPTGK
jgi:hypothetical protein